MAEQVVCVCVSDGLMHIMMMVVVMIVTESCHMKYDYSFKVIKAIPFVSPPSHTPDDDTALCT